METEQRYPSNSEPSIPEYLTSTYSPLPSEKDMFSNSMDMLLFNEFGLIVDYRGRFWQDEKKRAFPSQQLESSQSVESTVPIKQEEEDNWFGDNIQKMFPELANIYIPDPLHGVETILPEPQEYDIESALIEACKESHGIETIFVESQTKKDKTVKVKEESACKKLNDLPIKTERNIEEKIIENEINNFINQPTTSQKALDSFRKNASSENINPCIKKIKTEAESTVTKTIKQEEQKENVDIESISNKTQGKVIEAVDLSSLLEKFEEMEKLTPLPLPLPNLHNEPTDKNIFSRHTKSTIKIMGDRIKQLSSQDSVPKKSFEHTSNQHKVNPNLSLKFVEMTKIPKSDTLVIPTTIPNTEQSENRGNNTHQMQGDEHTLPSNSANSISSINFEHDYCIVYSDNNSVRNDHTSEPHTNENSMQSGRYNSLQQKNNAVSTEVSNMNQMPTVSALSNEQAHKIENSWPKINSILARNILKSRQRGPIIEIQTGSKVQQMVSVLRKPPILLPVNTKQCSSPNNMKECIMTTASSLNLLNNTIQNAPENMSLQDIKQPVKKINLNEYRERQHKNKTKSSARKKVVYLYNASTMTASSLEGSSKEEDRKDWSMREIDTMIITETEKKESAPKHIDKSVQTYETIFEFSESSMAQDEKNDVTEVTNESGLTQSESSIKRRSRSRTRNKSSSSGRSTSRSRSKSKNKSKTRKTSKSRNKSMYKKKRVESDNHKNKSRKRNLSTSTSRSKSSSRSRSRSNSRRRHHTYNKLRRRSRDSLSSTSSCTSNTRSRKRSRSSSYNSKSSSRYYSRRSRSPSVSSHKRSRRWSNDRERQYDRDRKYSKRESRNDRDLRSRSPPQYNHRPYNDRNRREWQRQVEERRVVYVGGIEDETTKADLRRRFEKFGRIVEISLHFRTQAVNFGFVTFEYKDDAYKAVEHGNDDHSLKYHLSFGGRRAFCQVNYADLDGAANGSYGNSNSPADNSSFDDLLQQALNRKKLV